MLLNQLKCVDLEVGNPGDYNVNHVHTRFFFCISVDLANPIMLTKDQRMTGRSYLYPICAVDAIVYVPQRNLANFV